MKRNYLSTVSIITSVLGLPFIPFYVPVVSVTLALVGIVTGIISKSQISKSGGKGSGLAITGIIIGALILVFWIVIPPVLEAIIDDINSTLQ